jgi:hypothetical protein
MFKDSKKYAANGTGWGWARWVGMEQKPYAKGANLTECITCHAPAKDNDWIFSMPVKLP